MVTLFDNDYTGLNEHRYTLNEIITGFGLDLGLDDYPIFDEDYRSTLNERIIDHFRFRRIAASTPQQFIYYLNRRMHENMPTYNKVYEKVLATNDPFLTTERYGEGDTTGNVTGAQNTNTTSDSTTVTQESTTSKSQGDTETSGTANATSTGRNIVSQTPASFMDNPADPKYMSNLTQTTSESENTSSGTEHTESQTGTESVGQSQTLAHDTTKADTTTDSTTNYVNRTIGRDGYLGDSILSAIVTGFLNTDLMVCDMLEVCFMQTWDDQPL